MAWRDHFFRIGPRSQRTARPALSVKLLTNLRGGAAAARAKNGRRLRGRRDGSVARARSPSSFLAHHGIAIKRFSRCPGIAERSARARPTDRDAASEFFALKQILSRARERRKIGDLTFGAVDGTLDSRIARRTSRGKLHAGAQTNGVRTPVDRRVRGEPLFASVIVSDLNETCGDP